MLSGNSLGGAATSGAASSLGGMGGMGYGQAGQLFGQGLGQWLGGMFANSGAPYEDAGAQYQNYYNQGIGYQNPFYNAGIQGMGNYQDMLAKMSNPNQFINNLMNSYQQSPWAQYSMQTGQNAANNAASAGGLLGSTPFSQFSQQQAQGIASQDMNQWLQNALGVNSQALQGYGNMMNMGAGAANQMTGLANQYGQLMGQSAFGQKMGQNQDSANQLGGEMDMGEAAAMAGLIAMFM